MTKQRWKPRWAISVARFEGGRSLPTARCLRPGLMLSTLHDAPAANGGAEFHLLPLPVAIEPATVCTRNALHQLAAAARTAPDHAGRVTASGHSRWRTIAAPGGINAGHAAIAGRRLCAARLWQRKESKNEPRISNNIPQNLRQ